MTMSDLVKYFRHEASRGLSATAELLVSDLEAYTSTFVWLLDLVSLEPCPRLTMSKARVLRV